MDFKIVWHKCVRHNDDVLRIGVKYLVQRSGSHIYVKHDVCEYILPIVHSLVNHGCTLK
jgi:hypothetical protein